MGLTSVMKHNFSNIPSPQIQRSTFNRSHGYKTTFNEDDLVPVFCDEVLPGDTFKLRAHLFARLQTPVVPIMDNLFLETFYFFVPTRLLWDNWQKFNGEQINPGDSTDYTVPQIELSAPVQSGSLSDYLGLPVGVSNLKFNALPVRAYYRIWNEWFRDENLQDSHLYGLETGDGPDDGSTNNNTLCPRGKRHDYFTSCLPWPQKGPGVELPIGGVAHVDFAASFTNAPVSPTSPGQSAPRFQNDGGQSLGNLGASGTGGTPAGNVIAFTPVGTGANYATMRWADPQLSITQATLDRLQVNLANSTPISINDMRTAFQLQRMAERDARGGTRYTEILRAHFGVISPDARLQRPEYLGGSSQRVTITPVPQTASTDSTSPQGNLAAYGVVSDSSGGFTRSFVEHGYIIGLANIRADITYQQGLNRLWSRKTRYDFYWPALAHLGEQAVLNSEIYYTGLAADNQVFGYQERYAEYRYKPSLITGGFRSTATTGTPLDVWHLSEEFETAPALNAEFIKSSTPLSRVVAVPSEDHMMMDCYFDLKCTRPMPVYGVPGLIDHF